MNRAILLDTGPLGLVTHPKAREDNDECIQWLVDIVNAGASVFIPEIADYELRRELLRAGKTKGLRRLDELKEQLDYLPLTTPTMLKAAEYWATTRQQGKPTADDKALDGDVILAAQAAMLNEQGYASE